MTGRELVSITTVYGERLTVEEVGRSLVAFHSTDGNNDATRELTREHVATLVLALAEWLAAPRPELPPIHPQHD